MKDFIRNHIVSFILLLCLPLCELYTFWNKDTRIVQWILHPPEHYRPMTVRDNVWYLSQEIWGIVISVVIMIAVMDSRQRNPGNFASVGTFIVLNIFDILAYFYNMKTEHYSIIYPILLPAWGLIYYYGRRT
jgi:hypothetical protein